MIVVNKFINSILDVIKFLIITLLIIGLSSCSVMNTRFMITICSEDDTPPLSETYELNIKHHEDYGLILLIDNEGVKVYSNSLTE